MNKKTYVFIGTTGTIPNVPGDFPAGVSVDIDLDTNTVLETRLLNAPPVAIQMTIDGAEIATATSYSAAYTPPFAQTTETAPQSPSENEPPSPPVEQAPPDTAPSSASETQEPSSAPVDEQPTQQEG